MPLPQPRGPLSRWVVDTLTQAEGSLDGQAPVPDLDDVHNMVDVLGDDDVQLALWTLYELHYGGFEQVDEALEWDPTLITVRRAVERRMETALREQTTDVVDAALARSTDAAEAIFSLCAGDDAPGVVAHVHRSGDREQLLELLRHRSVYQLKEADPHTWLLPRLDGRAKTALLQIQYDEYGSARPEAVHQTLFARTLAACGLDPAYGAYVDHVPGSTLAVSNLASMLTLQRRLRAAGAGHLAAVEATSSLPSRKMSAAMTRLGYGEEATRFFDEHVEADSVHEQLAARELCGALVRQHPALLRDVVFGAAACLLVEGRFARGVLSAWEAGDSSLRTDAATVDAGATA